MRKHIPRLWPDEGLKAPVKTYAETFSAETLLLAQLEEHSRPKGKVASSTLAEKAKMEG